VNCKLVPTTLRPVMAMEALDPVEETEVNWTCPVTVATPAILTLLVVTLLSWMALRVVVLLPPVTVKVVMVTPLAPRIPAELVMAKLTRAKDEVLAVLLLMVIDPVWTTPKLTESPAPESVKATVLGE